MKSHDNTKLHQMFQILLCSKRIFTIIPYLHNIIIVICTTYQDSCFLIYNTHTETIQIHRNAIMHEYVKLFYTDPELHKSLPLCRGIFSIYVSVHFIITQFVRTQKPPYIVCSKTQSQSFS